MSDKKQKIVDHLSYEWWMLRATYENLKRVPGAVGDPVTNALVESLYVHGRSLIYFFCQPAKRDDDIVVKHLGGKREDEGKLQKKWLVQSNKRVAHLTEVRFKNLETFESMMKSAEELIDWANSKVAQLPETIPQYAQTRSAVLVDSLGASKPGQAIAPTGPPYPKGD